MTDLLQRWAAVVEAVEKADGPKFTRGDFWWCCVRYATVTNVGPSDKMRCSPGTLVHCPPAVIAVLEKWFREDVSDWFNKKYHACGKLADQDGNFYRLTLPIKTDNGPHKPETWDWWIRGWKDGQTFQECQWSCSVTCGTEAHLACAEAVCELIGGG